MFVLFVGIWPDDRTEPGSALIYSKRKSQNGQDNEYSMMRDLALYLCLASFKTHKSRPKAKFEVQQIQLLGFYVALVPRRGISPRAPGTKTGARYGATSLGASSIPRFGPSRFPYFQTASNPGILPTPLVVGILFCEKCTFRILGMRFSAWE